MFRFKTFLPLLPTRFSPYLCSILPAASEYLYILWRYVWLFWVSTLTRYIRLFLCQNCNWSPCSLAQFLRRVSFNAWRHVNYFGFSRYSESTASCDRTLLYKLHPAGANPAMHDKDVIEDLSDLIRSRKARPASDNTQNDMPTTDLPRWIDNRATRCHRPKANVCCVANWPLNRWRQRKMCKPVLRQRSLLRQLITGSIS